MKYFVVQMSVLFVCTLAAQAMLIPHFGIASLVLKSDIVVYCEESEVQEKEETFENATTGMKWTETKTITKNKALQSFKGDLPLNSEITVEYDSLFDRNLFMNLPYLGKDTTGKTIVVRHKAEYFPPGKALLFLRKSGSTYQVVDARLVQDGKVYQFIQMMNPGGLCLEEQTKPENFKLLKNEGYGEQELLKDMAIALKKATSLKEPVPMNRFPAFYSPSHASVHQAEPQTSRTR